jgi:hypothetical protein
MTTYLINKPTVVNSLAALPALQPQTAPALVQIDSCFDFVDQLNHAPQGRRYVMWSVANSLNNFIIGQLQSHIRAKRYATAEVNQAVDRAQFDNIDKESIDRFNEQKAAVDEILASTANRVEQGFEVDMPAIDVAEKLVNLRAYVAALMSANSGTKRDQAQPIGDSIAYRLSQMPTVDERKIMSIHVLTGLPLEILRKADLSVKMNDRQQLIEHMSEIMETAESLSWRHVAASDEIEGIFDTLPVQTRYRLIGNVIRALTAAMAAEVKALIRFGRLDSVTNRVLIDSVLTGYIAYFHKFEHDNSEAILAYEDRGIRLPTLDDFRASKD